MERKKKKEPEGSYRNLTSCRKNWRKIFEISRNVILNHALMKIRVVSGSHPIGPMGEMLNRIQHDTFFNVLKMLEINS